MRELFNLQAAKLKEQSVREISKLSPEGPDIDARMEAAYTATEMKDKLSGAFTKYEYVDIM